MISAFFSGILQFLTDFGVVAFFTLGAVIYINALFNYFIIGSGQLEEDVKEGARRQFVWASVCFLTGIALWGVVSFFWYIKDVNISSASDAAPRVFSVPNIPER